MFNICCQRKLNQFGSNAFDSDWSLRRNFRYSLVRLHILNTLMAAVDECVQKKNTQPNNGGEPPLWFVMRVEWWMASSAPATWIVGFYYSHRAEPFSFPSGRIRINRRAVTILLFALEAAEPDWKITLTAAKAICAPRFFDPCSNTAHCRRVASNKPMRDCVAECVYMCECVWLNADAYR